MELYTRTDTNPDIEVTTREYTHEPLGITIPVGFHSDGASTPRFLWAIIPPFKRVKKAAFIHDYLCKRCRNMSDRRISDEIFKDILRDVSKINPVRYWLGYLGVRLGAMFGVGIYFPHWTDKIKLFIRTVINYGK